MWQWFEGDDGSGAAQGFAALLQLRNYGLMPAMYAIEVAYRGNGSSMLVAQIVVASNELHTVWIDD